MERKLTTEMMAKLMAAESAAELMTLTREIGIELSEKDADGLFELLRTHAGEITEEELLKKFESIMEKTQILGQKLDDDELDAISGGGRASGVGGCSSDYYYENCGATVEKGSDCWGVDFCTVTNSRMHKVDGGCSSNYYNEKCAATVEDGSDCISNDRCSYLSVTYTRK
jgi:hypothetical protein